MVRDPRYHESKGKSTAPGPQPHDHVNGAPDEWRFDLGSDLLADSSPRFAAFYQTCQNDGSIGLKLAGKIE